MLMEWISQLSMPGSRRMEGMGCAFAIQSAKAWPASCVSTSTSPAVPLKFEKMNGSL